MTSENYQFENNPEFHIWDIEDYVSIDSKQRFKNSWLSKYLDTKSSVLDIGCGPGYTVKILQENDINVLGVDLNEVLVQKARAQGLNVKKMDALSAIKNFGDEFNFFLMSDFVEHVTLDVVFNILSTISKKPNSFIFICTPNLNSIMGFKFWFHMPTHINPMHPYVIRKMLKSMGYEVIEEWTEYGLLPGKGWKYKIRKKLLELLLGTQAELFLEGANINFIAKTSNRP